MSTSTIQTNSADAAAPSITMRRQKNVEQGFFSLRLRPCKPLKSHKTAKGFFGNAWRRSLQLSRRAAQQHRFAVSTRPRTGECASKTREGNFPACKGLKNNETRKESRGSSLMARRRSRRPYPTCPARPICGHPSLILRRPALDRLDRRRRVRKNPRYRPDRLSRRR